MPLDFHTTEIADGSTPTARTDRLILAFLPGVGNAAGAGAGDAVTTAITGLTLPAVYNVQVKPSQAAVASVSARTVSGFTITLTPLSSSTTLSAGTIDILVTA